MDTGSFPERESTKEKHLARILSLCLENSVPNGHIDWIPYCTKKAGIWFNQIQTWQKLLKPHKQIAAALKCGPSFFFFF